MNFLCSECSIELNKEEIELNKEFPIGKLYCGFCQSKQERVLIQKLQELDLQDFERELTNIN